MKHLQKTFANRSERSLPVEVEGDLSGGIAREVSIIRS